MTDKLVTALLWAFVLTCAAALAWLALVFLALFGWALK